MNVTQMSDFGGPEMLVPGHAPDPTAGPDEVVLAVDSAGVNPADALQRRGLYPPPPDAPAWPGLEVAGVVAEVGPGVDRWRVGDRVCALLPGGGYAERVVVDASLVLPIPEGLGATEAAALVEAACTVWSNLDAAHASAGDTVLVHGGLGGVGSIAVQYAAARGMRVLATARGPERVARCLELGAEAAFDHTADDWAVAVRELGGADVILDVVGAAYLQRNLEALAVGGRLVVIGLQKGSRAELDLGLLLARRASVIGTTLRARPLVERAAVVAGVERDVWPLVPGRVRPLVAGTFRLAEAASAHRALEAGGLEGSLVLTVGADRHR